MTFRKPNFAKRKLKNTCISLVLLLNITVFGQNEKDSIHKIGFATIPIVNYNKSFGGTFGVVGQMFYSLKKSDTISPKSSTSFFGVYTTNKSYFLGLFQKMYLRKDNWRVTFGGGVGTINFQFWQELPTVGGSFIGYSTNTKFLFSRVDRRIYKRLYGGLTFAYVKVKTTFDVPEYFPDDQKMDQRNLNSFGYQFLYDNRDHQINPYKGFNAEFKNNFFSKSLGNSTNFQKYELTYNHFFTLRTTSKILATRLNAAIGGGDVPFQSQNTVGQDDIRGYTSGKYRGNQIYTLQTEYRWRFYKRFGMVAFGGLAGVVDSEKQTVLLPGVGAGFRYLVLKDQRINIGVDYAVGKHDWGLYFRIGESFGR